MIEDRVQNDLVYSPFYTYRRPYQDPHTLWGVGGKVGGG